jgi:DUF1680 family protein
VVIEGVKAAMATVADTSRSPYAKLWPVPVGATRLEDDFWAPRLELLREATLPLQHRLLEETGRMFNFRRASGRAEGEFSGFYFNDSDVYKWLEAMGFALAYSPDECLRGMAQGVVKEISAAQDAEGYLDTYFALNKKAERWRNLRDLHELYCAGHLIQAAVAFYRATENRELLDAATSFADNIASIFGPSKQPGTPGHPEIEMALVELYRLNGEEAYLNLARFFLDQRGHGVIGGRAYHVDHEPFRELEEVAGHAVRSLYMNCGAADIYLETGERALWEALERLWLNMTERRMYVTGGVGARHDGEAFGEDYELPSRHAYAETCAAIASVMWNWRMLLASGEAKYADALELALYNGVLPGISLNGERYFYVNPLADRGGHRRQTWFPCACCPPNVARTLASLPGYFYSASKDGFWVHLYARSTSQIKLEKTAVRVTQETEYPWEGEVTLILEPKVKKAFALHLRIPGWSREPELLVNGEPTGIALEPGSHARLERVWEKGDEVRLDLPMPVERILSNPLVLENAGRVALKRGPIVYCLEQVDNPDADVWGIAICTKEPIEAAYRPDVLNGVVTLRGAAHAIDADFDGKLYRPMSETPSKKRRTEFTAIPYYAWANREPGPMIVWARSENSQD